MRHGGERWNGMSSDINTTTCAQPSIDIAPPDSHRRRRLVVAFTILAFIAIGAVALYAISLIIGSVILLILSALLAYLLYPLVQVLQRRLTRPLAIVVAYLLLVSLLAVSMFIITSSLIRQSSSLTQSIQFLLSPAGERQTQSLLGFLGTIGITTDQINLFKEQLLSQAQNLLSGLLPFLIGLFSNVINLFVTIMISIYFIIDGSRIIRWLSLKTPLTQRSTIQFLLHTLDQSLGGYFRGSLLIAFIGALGTGVGLALLHIPYAALLGTLFFLFYFVPVIGPYVIEALCILAALPQGWVMMFVVAIFMTAFQGIVIGQVLSPRIFSKTVGIHPIVAFFALFAGAELFGLLGGFFAIPIAGILQQIIVALWHRWEKAHPAQFPPEESPL
jgi:predicted PurR-regulated permease PerM